MFKLCPGAVVLEVFCLLITFSAADTKCFLIGHNINLKPECLRGFLPKNHFICGFSNPSFFSPF